MNLGTTQAGSVVMTFILNHIEIFCGAMAVFSVGMVIYTAKRDRYRDHRSRSTRQWMS